MLCLPRGAVAPLQSKSSAQSSARRPEKVLQSGAHVPTWMIVIIMLLQAVAAPVPRPHFSAKDECDLRLAVQGTVWQPGLVANFPGTLLPASVVQTMREILPPFNDSTIVWAQVPCPPTKKKKKSLYWNLYVP